MKQYCRYCVYLTTGNGIYCSKKKKFYSENSAKSVNNCPHFDFIEIDAFFENMLPYHPRPRPMQQCEGQLSFEDIDKE